MGIAQIIREDDKVIVITEQGHSTLQNNGQVGWIRLIMPNYMKL